jgi:hypothetical protein
MVDSTFYEQIASFVFLDGGRTSNGSENQNARANIDPKVLQRRSLLRSRVTTQQGHFDGHKFTGQRTTSSPLFFSQDQLSDERIIEISLVASLLTILLLESEEARIETKKYYT